MAGRALRRDHLRASKWFAKVLRARSVRPPLMLERRSIVVGAVGEQREGPATTEAPLGVAVDGLLSLLGRRRGGRS